MTCLCEGGCDFLVFSSLFVFIGWVALTRLLKRFSLKARSQTLLLFLIVYFVALYSRGPMRLIPGMLSKSMSAEMISVIPCSFIVAR